jgi:small conductance mechanosensitive channel
MKKIENSFERILDAILEKVPSIALGLVILIGGIYGIRLIIKILHIRFEKRQVDPSLREFVLSVLRFLLYAMLVISVASTMGFKTTSFLAVLSAASLAIGLSLQGSLSNLAGGVLILIFKPFRVGDSIQSSAGASGAVEKIDILYTTLRTADGIAVFSPNGSLANSIITNFSDIQSRRIEYKLSISSSEDVRKVRNLILEVLRKDTRILSSPTPQVLVSDLTSNAVNLVVYSWAAKVDYSSAFYENQESIREMLNAHQIVAPPSQNEIHIVATGDKKS